MKCAICGRAVVAAFRPFCSGRCADVDLAKWLNGSYAASYDDPDCGGPLGVRIDGVEFAGLDQGGDDAPVCGSCIVTSKERILAAQGDWTDRAFDRAIVHLNTPVG